MNETLLDLIGIIVVRLPMRERWALVPDQGIAYLAADLTEDEAEVARDQIIAAAVSFADQPRRQT